MCIIKVVLTFIFYVSLLAGCSTLQARTQNRDRLLAISEGNLKGMSKVEAIKVMGQPLATSKSEVSECWYYAEPKSIWLWFEQDKVEHWEVE